MSEEDVNLEHVEVPSVEGASEAEAPQFSEVEVAAMEQGWKPPQEFNEEGKEPVSAEEFLRRGELFEKIKEIKSQYRKDTRRLEDKIREMSYLMHEERARGYEQALLDLDAKRKEAVEIGDIDAFNSLDSEYSRVKEEKAKLAAQAAPVFEQEVPVAALEFQERNSDWFNSNTSENNSMVNQAVTIETYLSREKPYLSDEQRLAIVEKEIKELYPHRFTNPKRREPSKVEAPAKETTVAKANAKGLLIKESDLGEREKAAAKRFLAMDPSLTMEDYLKSVQEGLRIRNQL